MAKVLINNRGYFENGLALFVNKCNSENILQDLNSKSRFVTDREKKRNKKKKAQARAAKFKKKPE